MTVNQQTVEETKQQIRVLVNEIAALSKSGAPAEEYYPQLLQRIITALAAVGGAVWVVDEDQSLRLQYQINIGESLVDEESEDAIRHHRLIRRVAASGQTLLVPPYSGTTDDVAEGNPTRYLLVLAPLKNDKRVDGMIEIFQRPDAAPATQQGYLRFLQQMSELASDWLKGQQLRLFSDRQVLWQQADSFARAVHESLDVKETAFVVANEGRRLIGCDRVSVAIKKGRRCRVRAISGQDTIENRSNIVAALNNLTTRVVAAGEPLWHDGSTEDLPPQIEEALEEYVDLSYGRHLAVLPLRAPEKDDSAGDIGGAVGRVDRDGGHRGEVIGALIVEQIESELPPEVFHRRVDLVYEHSTRALANSIGHSNLFLMPLWNALGKASFVVRARTLPKTLAVVAVLLAIVLGLIFIPRELQLQASGALRPDVRHEIFAPLDGEVIEVLVDHNAAVVAGQPLVRLRNRDLEVQLTDTAGQINTTIEEIGRITGQLNTARSMEPVDRFRLEGEELELEAKLVSLRERLALLKEKANQLTVTAPIDGRVVTWDVEKTLRSRPVMTGQVLLEVADLTQPMHLELQMPEKRMSHLDRAMRQAGDRALPVQFILQTDPDKKMWATLLPDSIELRVRPEQENGSVVTMRAIPEDPTLGGLRARPGAKVIANAQAGQRASGFVFGYEVYEWLCKWFF